VQNVLRLGLISSLRYVFDALRKYTDAGYGRCIQTWRLTIMTEQEKDSEEARMDV
jgi:hypothetical protein